MSTHLIDVSDISLGEEYDGLDVSVVGGTPRDRYMSLLLGVDIESNDIDLVTTGVTPEYMKKRGFKHIMSNDTRKPVFIDSDRREVAVARSEQSSGDEHDAFEMDIISPDIPHKKAMMMDLERRDLTINAIAVNIRNGEVYDPHNGREDIENGIIRHVSEAFSDDPLRVVRAARYASRFGFEIAPETLDMMKKTSDKVRAIPDPRFGLELIKVFKQAESPRRFFDTLSNVGALTKSYPEISALQRVPAGPPKYHKEGDAYEHTMRVVTSMYEQLGNNVNGLLAALFHDVGKPATSPDTLPHHYGHEGKGSDMAKGIHFKYEFVRERRGVIDKAARSHMQLSELSNVNTTTVLKYANMIQNSPLTVEEAVALGKADAEGREPKGEFDIEETEKYLSMAISVNNDIGGIESLNARGYTQEDVDDKIPGERVGNLISQDRAEEFRDRMNN
jgi:tRNA nucleotidyltransferase (CCA-adding enzyme)